MNTLNILKGITFVRVQGTRELYMELSELCKLLNLQEFTLKEVALRVPNLAYVEMQLKRAGSIPKLTTLYPVESLLRLAFNSVVKRDTFQEFITLKINRLLVDGFVSLEEMKLPPSARERLIEYVTGTPYAGLPAARGTARAEDGLTAHEVAALRGLDLGFFLLAKYLAVDIEELMPLLDIRQKEQ